jgi:hypothetical protein
MNAIPSNPRYATLFRRHRRVLGLTAVLAVLLTSAVASRASTIAFNNIPSAPQYYNPFGDWTGNFQPNTYDIAAMNFTPSVTGTLNGLTLGLFKASLAGTTATTLRLSPEVANMPSAPIWQGTVTAAAGLGQLSILTGIGGPTLTSGQTYWLEAFPPQDGVTLDFWDVNNQGDMGSIMGGGAYVPSTNRFALRVGVNAAPERSSLALAVCGLALIGFCIVPRRGPRAGGHPTSQTSRKRSAQSRAQSGSQCTTPPACCGRAAKDRESSPRCAR